MNLKEVVVDVMNLTVLLHSVKSYSITKEGILFRKEERHLRVVSSR